MNLLLVDDHTLFREGLRGLLANISPGVAIHEAATVDEAVDACRTTAFRMVLLDLGLTNTSGLDTLDRFRAGVPDVPVVVLSGDQEPRHIRSTIERGAAGFIPKSHSTDLMIAALRFVLAGGVYLPPRALEAPAETATASFARLSPRQQQVLQMLLRGCPNKVIAKQLSLSEGTVKAHVSAIFQILGARNRTEAVIVAANSGIKVM